MLTNPGTLPPAPANRPAADPLEALPLVQRIIQGVEYYHTRTAEGGDLFLTRFGLPFAAHLLPENWLDAPWFESHRRRLRGTSTIYRTQTRPLRGRALDVVVRFNRVAQHIPADTVTRAQYTHASFNSPFEEVTTLMKLRAARCGPKGRRICTKRPLLIYSPPTRLRLWQTGRNETELAVKQAQLPEIELDILRPYIVVYGWIRGMDAQDAAGQYGGASRHELLDRTLAEVEDDLRQAGFRVLDMKPAHIIVRFARDGQLLRRKDGRLIYALIDYELLEPLSVT